MNECRAPKSKQEFEQYYHLRWLILRAPLQQATGSEQDDLEQQAIHRCIFDAEQNIIAVGRLHFTDQYTAQIRYMAVSDSAQGKGCGKVILQALEFVARQRGAKTIELKARKHAIDFYQQAQYQKGDFSHLLYGEVEHFNMSKQLDVLPEHQSSLAMQLQDTWHQTIPLSKAMNIAISYFDQQQLLTHCEPLFNKNLHNTMFAGSIYTLATLTGWGWVYLQLLKDKCSGDIVLAEANIKYLAPIAGIASARTEQKFVKGNTALLHQNKREKLTVEVEVLSGEKVAAKFTGCYVVLPKGDK